MKKLWLGLVLTTAMMVVNGLVSLSFADDQPTCVENGPNLPGCVAQATKNKEACVKTPTSESCSKSYSCEGLFQEHSVAVKCNYDRCIKERDISYCTCKYGEKGDGKKIGIPLNTNIPFLGSCIGKSDGSTSNTAALTAFPTIIQAASKILVTVILLSGFIMIVVGGVQWASGNAKAGLEIIKKVGRSIVILGFMGAILRLINPNFFK